MLNLSSGKVLTPQCVLWLAAQMKVFQSFSLVMEFFFNTNLVFTMCYLIPPNHIFTSLNLSSFIPFCFNQSHSIYFYFILTHAFPFISIPPHLIFSLIQSHFFAYTSLFPYHINPLSSFLHPFHPILSHLIICHAVAMYTIPSYFVPSPFSPPIPSHPIFSLVFDLLSSFLIQSHVVSHPISAIPTHFISPSHVISVLIQCHPILSYCISCCPSIFS